jgi:hypothetical protein
MCSLPCLFLAWACEMTGLIVWRFRCLLWAHKHRPLNHHVCHNMISHVNSITIPTSLLINACHCVLVWIPQREKELTVLQAIGFSIFSISLFLHISQRYYCVTASKCVVTIALRNECIVSLEGFLVFPSPHQSACYKPRNIVSLMAIDICHGLLAWISQSLKE